MRSSGATLALYCSTSASVGVRFFWPPAGGVIAQADSMVLAADSIITFISFVDLLSMA